MLGYVFSLGFYDTHTFDPRFISRTSNFVLLICFHQLMLTQIIYAKTDVCGKNEWINGEDDLEFSPDKFVVVVFRIVWPPELTRDIYDMVC